MKHPHSFTRIVLVLSASACAWVAFALMGPEGMDFSLAAVTALFASLAFFGAALIVQTICSTKYRPSWFESVFPAVTGGGILIFSYLWTIPLRDTPTIFHPVLLFQIIGLIWVIFFLIAAFRSLNRS